MIMIRSESIGPAQHMGAANTHCKVLEELSGTHSRTELALLRDHGHLPEHPSVCTKTSSVTISGYGPSLSQAALRSRDAGRSKIAPRLVQSPPRGVQNPLDDRRPGKVLPAPDHNSDPLRWRHLCLCLATVRKPLRRPACSCSQQSRQWQPFRESGRRHEGARMQAENFWWPHRNLRSHSRAPWSRRRCGRATTTWRARNEGVTWLEAFLYQSYYSYVPLGASGARFHLESIGLNPSFFYAASP